ncbi:hypothetical protein pdam_00018531 [Pocillopora damicornis]|uniref:Uncharacterized protein n=1 Tax=Pocillopora damicornis TaxID=46731 RepID=A0A3M6TBQ3_POCDA|nr:hypothetical protein pdam_00018531 [Pocillopora damicornis]
MYFRLRLKDTKGIVPTKCLRTEFSSELLEFSTDFVNVLDNDDALALKCNVCTNLPAQAGISGKPCTTPDVMECPFGMDRCMTIDGELAIPGAGSLEFTVKNCSNNALICAPDGLANSE